MTTRRRKQHKRSRRTKKTVGIYSKPKPSTPLTKPTTTTTAPTTTKVTTDPLFSKPEKSTVTTFTPTPVNELPKDKLPLKLIYNSPSGPSFDPKLITECYELESAIYTNPEDFAKETNQSGTVIAILSNCSSHNRNERCITLNVTLFIYDHEHLYGAVYCTFTGIVSLNTYGIMQDGDYKFNIMFATEHYKYLNPKNGEYTTVILQVKNGVRIIDLPAPTEAYVEPVPITLENITQTHYACICYKYFNETTFSGAIPNVHKYELSANIFDIPDPGTYKELKIAPNKFNTIDNIITNIDNVCGSLLWNGYIAQTFTDKTKHDIIFYYTYTIHNKYGTGNIHVIITEMYTPLTQQGSFAISNNNNHVGLIAYADGDFSYLSPKNKVYSNLFIFIAPETGIRTLYLPIKTGIPAKIGGEPVIPRSPSSSSSLITYNKFYTLLPTVIGSNINRSINETYKHHSREPVGTSHGFDISIPMTKTYSTYSLFADVFDENKNYIGMTLQTYRHAYINKNPVTIAMMWFIFSNNTFISIVTVSNKELNGTGSFKDGEYQFGIFCSSANYKNPKSAERNTVKTNLLSAREYEIKY